MIETDPKILFDHGILFELNRQILHPLGFSLVFKERKSSEESNTLVLLRTHDEEGVLFPEKSFMEGAAKFSIFMKNIGEKALQKRMSKIGFLRQTRSDQ